MFVKPLCSLSASTCQQYEDHKRWETGSQHSESSFPTASMVGAFPMVHDLPPLQQPEVPQNNHMLHVHRSEPEVPHHHAQTLHAHRNESEVPHHHAQTLHGHRNEPEVPHHAHMLHVHRKQKQKLLTMLKCRMLTHMLLPIILLNQMIMMMMMRRSTYMDRR
ncbi:unnamed protein product [Lactuca virosa]|uniref:Uncharacterized protein n=1 Tax=Lactuca virosa TaxID=75947 RepID=A0AAU9P6Y6_9ASTR|nr:unnamed protein product [Lactuca virosa]